MLGVLEQTAVTEELWVNWPLDVADDDEFFEELCRLNRDLRIEATADGKLIIMPPTYSRTGNRNFNLIGEIYAWSRRDGTGLGFDSSAGFILDNGAKRSPDASWVRRERLDALSAAEKEKFLPLCPDVVFELRSHTDKVDDLREKMREYIANGAQLGFLLVPTTRRVYIYRADGTEELLDQPESVSGEPVMAGFVLQLRPIWELDF